MEEEQNVEQENMVENVLNRCMPQSINAEDKVNQILGR
jgi:hypothetical protein